MCKKEDMATGLYYKDDENNVFEEYVCGTCGCSKFIEVPNLKDKVIEYADLTDEANTSQTEEGLSTHCHCGEEGYVLVKVKEQFFDTIQEYNAWLDNEEGQYNIEECHQCGNKEKLEIILDKIDGNGDLQICCPKCHCLDDI